MFTHGSNRRERIRTDKHSEPQFYIESPTRQLHRLVSKEENPSKYNEKS